MARRLTTGFESRRFTSSATTNGEAQGTFFGGAGTPSVDTSNQWSGSCCLKCTKSTQTYMAWFESTATEIWQWAQIVFKPGSSWEEYLSPMACSIGGKEIGFYTFNDGSEIGIFFSGAGEEFWEPDPSFKLPNLTTEHHIVEIGLWPHASNAAKSKSRLVIRNEQGELLFDHEREGNIGGTGTLGSWTFGNLGSSTCDVYISQAIINDSTGESENGQIGYQKVALLKPVSDNSREGFVTGAGGTTNLFNAVDNYPPVGVANGSKTATSQIYSATNNTNHFYRANTATYEASIASGGAGLIAGDTITAMMTLARVGNSSGTARNMAVKCNANPVIPEATTATSGTAGTDPTGWRTITSSYIYAPTPTRSSGAQPNIRKAAGTTDATACDSLGVYLSYRPFVKSVYETTVLEDSPVGYWRLGEISGTVASDSSGGGHSGTYKNTPTLGQPGALLDGNTAVSFLSSSKEYVEVPDAISLRLGDTWTMELWVKIPSGTTQARLGLLGKGSGEFALRAEYLEGEGGYFFTALSRGAAEPLAYGSVVITDGNWHHVVVTRDGEWSTTIYIDGTDVTIPNANVECTTTTEPVTIGSAAGTGSSEMMLGWIDEVALYPTALNAERIATHFAAAGGTVLQHGSSYGEGKSLLVKLPSVATSGHLLVSGVGIDKDSGTDPVPSEGWTVGKAHHSASVSIALAYRVATGTSGDQCTWSTSNTIESAAWIVETNMIGTPTLGSAVSFTNESEVTSVALGPVIAKGSGMAIAFVAIDTADNWDTGTACATWSNGFVEQEYYGSTNQNAGGSLTWKGVEAGTSVSTTATAADPVPDQASGILIVFSPTKSESKEYSTSLSETLSQSDSVKRSTVVVRIPTEITSISETNTRAAGIKKKSIETLSTSDGPAHISPSTFARKITETLSISDLVSIAGHAYFKSIGETFSISDSAKRTFIGVRINSESISTSEIPSRTSIRKASVTDILGTSDSLSRVGIFLRGIAQSASVIENPSRVANFLRGKTDTIHTSDDYNLIQNISRNAPESLTTLDSIKRQGIFNRAGTEITAVSDNTNRFTSTIRKITNTIFTFESSSRFYIAIRKLTENIPTSDSVIGHKSLFRIIIETLTTNDLPNRVAGSHFGRNIVDSNVLTELVKRTIVVFREVKDFVTGLDAPTRKISTIYHGERPIQIEVEIDQVVINGDMDYITIKGQAHEPLAYEFDDDQIMIELWGENLALDRTPEPMTLSVGPHTELIRSQYDDRLVLNLDSEQ